MERYFDLELNDIKKKILLMGAQSNLNYKTSCKR